MKNKVLIVTTTLYMVRQFLQNDIKILRDKGYDVEIATNTKNTGMIDAGVLQSFIDKLEDDNVNVHQIEFSRSPLNVFEHKKSYDSIVSLLEENNYKFIHVHTPIAGAISRIAARKKNVKVVYTAHGFHFYKGAPLLNWVLFYPVEKYCSRFTDTIITINKEDYMLASNKMKSRKVEYIPGIGMDLFEFKPLDADSIKKKREELSMKDGMISMLSVGELNKNKNHRIVIEAMAKMDNKNIEYYIAGKGDEKDSLIELATKLGVSDRLHFLGFRTDIRQLCQVFDLFVFPSYREGLSVSLMEAMASGLPCVVGNIRGNCDLIDEKGGALFNPADTNDCKCAIEKVLNSDISSMKEYNLNKIKSFDSSIVKSRMAEIYSCVEQ